MLVTGASRGIGRRAAENLAPHGAKLALTARSADELAKLAAQLRGAGAEVETYPCDLTDPAARERLVADVVARFGALDVLVNCAGVASFGEFATSTPEILRKVTEINFFAPAEMIRLCQPHLMASSLKGPKGWRAAVVNVASICGRWGIPSLSEHCGSKHALVGLTEALRGEFARYDIDVLLVLPGVVRSDDLNRHLLRNDGRIYLDFEGAQRPEEVGVSVARSLIRNRTEAAVGFVSWWVWFGKRAAPRVVRWVMQRKVARYMKRAGAGAQA
ncbi:Short-chain dehydrogenase/reductase SDR [Fimbriiglobus ruber]|uniref:Short-chain dehydrogenase/reductase SDR n=1 Tax=Fimbriiglobus ruber TaxID=1908690 RepID=A0A225DMT5_9BACT|nr:Short-chain dehydrogenase/reductase SDR [Fimbriiglobus ruber]